MDLYQDSGILTQWTYLHGEGFFVAGNVRVQLTYISILAGGPVLQLHFFQLMLFVCSKTI